MIDPKTPLIPFLLVRADWLGATVSWLQWAREQMSPDKVKSDMSPEDRDAFILKCSMDLEELVRIAGMVAVSSPLVYQRPSSEEVELSDLQFPPMPPKDPNERGH